MALSATQKRKSVLSRKGKKNTSLTKRQPGDYYDFSLVAVIVILTVFGLIMLYSTSAYTAEIQFGDDMYYFKKQALISVGCIVAALAAVRIFDYHYLGKKPVVYFLYFAALVLMFLVRTPLGVTSHGARRWIGVGPLTFQPAEVAKIAVIVMLSYMIVTSKESTRSVSFSMKMAAFGGVQALAAYILTDNLSTALIILGITVGMIFLAHPDTWIFVLIIAVLAVLAVFMVMTLTSSMENSTNFRLQRILVWLHPEDYAAGDGYQTLQALYAIGSGGFFGRGLGNSIQKLGSVPEAQNDFIFSIICEELGIFGGVVLLIVFAYLLYRLFFIAQNAPDLLGSFLVSGIFIHISLQVILNIAVVLNLLPNTGVTLPFISYGGTSVLFLMAEMAVALNVARQIRLRQPRQIL